MTRLIQGLNWEKFALVQGLKFNSVSNPTKSVETTINSNL